MLKNQKGFTLIELLIVVVIIGILAAIALPKFGSTRTAAYYSTLKADLNNLRSAQEIYYTNGKYEYAPTAATDGLEYQSSTGTTVNFTVTGTGQGYAAQAFHNALDDSSEGCALYYGDGAGTGLIPVPSAAGTIRCTD